ncbi:NADP-dependent oxidoreductase domain [Sesbania bispinosa]|nr:NADP-dependent oxidoreductase domain [Sesbania bispinosa]
MAATTTIPEVVLRSSSGQRKIPVIGLGTAPEAASKVTTKDAVLEAIKQGYRHFDAASAYGVEQSVGEAIAEALKLGLIASRDDLFITSKLWVTDNHPELIVPALHKSLRTLQLEYLDLFLIHWPITTKPGEVEINLGWQQVKLREFCKEKGITLTAFSPLRKGASRGANLVMDNDVLKELADAHGKTVAQICLRWIYEQGVTFVVKSYDKERMKQNLQIFDWSLTEDDYKKISEIYQERLIKGPTKPLLDDLWDEEQ